MVRTWYFGHNQQLVFPTSSFLVTADMWHANIDVMIQYEPRLIFSGPYERFVG